MNIVFNHPSLVKGLPSTADHRRIQALCIFPSHKVLVGDNNGLHKVYPVMVLVSRSVDGWHGTQGSAIVFVIKADVVLLHLVFPDHRD